MTVGWNFERRRDTCARFLIGVWVLAKGVADRDTSLEAVRHRMKLSPEEALFAARRLNDDALIAFEAGAVRSTAPGVTRAESLMADTRAKVLRFAEVSRALAARDTSLAVIAAVIRADGGALACGAPDDDPDATFRLALDGDAVTLERQRPDGAFEPASLG